MSNKGSNRPTYHEQLRRHVREYKALGMPWPTESRQIALWAIQTGRWKAPQSAIVTLAAADFSDAMREEITVDPQGRSVRTKLAVRIAQGKRQLTLWGDIQTFSRDMVELGFKQRRQAIVGDCWQLKRDVDSYNDNRSPAQPIQMIFDFTEDMRELEAVAPKAA